MVELAVVLEELGRVMAPVPFLATVSAVRARRARARRRRAAARASSARVAEGTCTGTLAITEAGGSYDPARVGATATPDGDGYVLAGTKQAVVDATTVDEIAVVARLAGTPADEGGGGDDGVGAFVVPRADVAVERDRRARREP